MVKFLTLSAFRCFEYVIVLLFIISLTFVFEMGLDKIVPWTYDYESQDTFIKELKQARASKQITPRQAEEIFLAYEDEQIEFQKRRTYILYAVSACISAGLAALLFKKYRSLRFRERFGDYFFPPKL